jgi:hypothetical protein
VAGWDRSSIQDRDENWRATGELGVDWKHGVDARVVCSTV